MFDTTDARYNHEILRALSWATVLVIPLVNLFLSTVLNNIHSHTL